MPRALIALAVGAFAIGCTEFVVIGLLPQIGDGLHATVPAMGILITAYAIGVMIGAPAMTALSSRFSTRQTLIGLMGLFIVGNTLSAFAPNYRVLMGARVITALAHGSFFGVGAIVARRAVAPEKATQAISLMFLGLTISNVIGVPAATWIGQQIGWRYVFGGIAALGVVTVVALRAWVPDDDIRMDMKAELGAFRRKQVWLGLAITTIGFGAFFAMYSYIAPILTDLAGIGENSVTLVLVLFGVGTTVGALVGGRLGDRYGLRLVGFGLFLEVVILAAFTVTSHNAVAATATLMLFGVVGFGLGPVVQNRIIESAGTDGSMVSAVNQGAFNVANAIGAAAGAYVIRAGYGLTGPMWVGAVLAAAGCVLVVVTIVTDRRRAVRLASPRVLVEA
ncbi:MFS transporter, DHA1 family, arabinose polymer transporter [Nakamurella panacisegetis]|uniref:MFS transporter, DHA1 family, arabinose polymer transporter n=1 Tax=Nakamurella panacisegetis TaxID=1090615 RepID=A0A1H0JT02_9ACTN|nr:MFS transporter [Nakamurella panacisegetis]SDO46866.1 MFS transporter, DHA1 family, arabinose polymer transporter [Nakamurella panacisegetis]